jgi:uncharacterized phiE125 gp8 family phage protein
MTVTLAQAKGALGIRHSDDDTYITDLIARAKAWVERFTAKLTVQGEVVDTFSEFGDFLTLSRGPFVSLTSLGYVADGEDATIDPETVSVFDGQVYPPADGWPEIDDHSAITATYQAGYATTPPELDQAMVVLIQHWYEPDDKTPLDERYGVPLAVTSLAGPFRTPTVA